MKIQRSTLSPLRADLMDSRSTSAPIRQPRKTLLTDRRSTR